MTAPKLAQYYSEANQDGRAYRHPFRKNETGNPLISPSVTTVLKLVDKSGLAQWAADQAMEWAVKNVNLLLSRSEESGYRAGRFRWKDVADERAEVGTGIHETIEAEHTGSWDYPVLDAEQQQIMSQWRRLQERYEFTPKQSEVTIWNLKEDYAGTADGIWDILDRETGEFHEDILIDLKTSKRVWDTHWMQLSALYASDVMLVEAGDRWQEQPAVQYNGVGVIHLRADEASVILESDKQMIDLRYRQFLGYRNLWGLGKQVAALEKSREIEF